MIINGPAIQERTFKGRLKVPDIQHTLQQIGKRQVFNFPNYDDAVELEIRAAGGEALCIWVDDMRID